jgi:hypothetical protein
VAAPGVVGSASGFDDVAKAGVVLCDAHTCFPTTHFRVAWPGGGRVERALGWPFTGVFAIGKINLTAACRPLHRYRQGYRRGGNRIVGWGTGPGSGSATAHDHAWMPADTVTVGTWVPPIAGHCLWLVRLSPD